MQVYYSTSFDIDVEDTNNCIFTDSTKTNGFSSAAPTSASNKFFTIVSTQQKNNNGDFVADLYLPTPKTVASGDTPSVNIVTDMIHSVFTTAQGAGNAGDQLKFDADLNPPVHAFATFGDSGKAEYYTEKNTAESVSTGTATSEIHVRVYYSGATPAFVENDYIPGCAIGNFPTQAQNANPASSPADGSGTRSGGYLGIDASNLIAWAEPVDGSYKSYRSIFTMRQGTAKGTSTNLICQFLGGDTNTVKTAPAPQADGLYDSNNNALITTATTTQALNLVAN